MHTEKTYIFSFQTHVTVQYFIDFIIDEISYIYPNKKIEILETDTLLKIDYPKNDTLKKVFTGREIPYIFYINLLD